MFDIGEVEREWANVCPVDAHTILHGSTEVVRAARRQPAHRLEPYAEFSAGVFWKQPDQTEHSGLEVEAPELKGQLQA